MKNEVSIGLCVIFACLIGIVSGIVNSESSRCASGDDGVSGEGYVSIEGGSGNIGSCYKLHTNTLTWEESEAVCREEGAHLATASSIHEATTIRGAFSSHHDFWIGLRMSVDGQWKWESKGEGDKGIQFKEWISMDDALSSSGGDHSNCALFTGKGWSIVECSVSNKFLCEVLFDSRPISAFGRINSQQQGDDDYFVWTQDDDSVSKGPTGNPSGQPSVQPSASPSGPPSLTPTCGPTGQPSVEPSSCPSSVPSGSPSTQPSSGQPSLAPTSGPTGQPSVEPSTCPSSVPSGSPSIQPSSSQPSLIPTCGPTGQPSVEPSSCPTFQSSAVPSGQPSVVPSCFPTVGPTRAPYSQPSGDPSSLPTLVPNPLPSCAPSSLPTTTPSMEAQKDLAPGIISIGVLETGARGAIRINVNMTKAAIVDCGVFYDSGGSAVNISSAAIRFQRWGNITFTTTSSLTINGLQEGLFYNLYCMTSSLDGMHDMALANILNTRREIYLPCSTSLSCNKTSLVIDIPSKHLMGSSLMTDVLTVRMNNRYFLEDDVVAFVEVTIVDNSTNCNFSDVLVVPQFIEFAAAGQGYTDKVEVSVSANCIGKYNVNVTIQSAEMNSQQSTYDVADNIDVMYSNGHTFEIFSSASNMLDPAALNALFVSAESEVVVSFDSFTNLANMENTYFKCSLLMSFPGDSLSQCHWRDSLSLVITLNSDSTILPGSFVKVKAGLVRPHGFNNASIPAAASDVRTLSSSSTEVLVTPDEGVFPRVQVSAPTLQASCVPFTFDLLSSYGFVGRAWENSSVTVRSAKVRHAEVIPVDNNNTELVKLNDFFALSDIEAVIDLPVEYLEAGFMYIFDVQLCNCLGKCSLVSHPLWVSLTYVPFSLFRDSSKSRRSISRADAVTVESSVLKNEPCPYPLNSTTVLISQVWTILKSNIDVTNNHHNQLLQITANKIQMLSLPTYSFPSAMVYEVIEEVMVTVVDSVTGMNNITFKSLVLIEVSRSAVSCILSTPREVMVSKNETKLIDASGSYDADADIDMQSEGLHFHWHCMRIGPLTVDFVTDCAGFLNVNESHRSLAILDPAVSGAHTGSEYRITLSVYSSDMSAYDSIVLSAFVVSFCCVTIELDPIELYNVNKDLLVSAHVGASLRGYLTWSVSDISSTVLREIALTPTTLPLESVTSHSRSVHLKLPPHILQAGLSYRIQLSFVSSANNQGVSDGLTSGGSAVFSSITVVPNRLPLPGLFTVTPNEGSSLQDIFIFQARLWSSDQLPLVYSFGFTSVSSGLVVFLQRPAREPRLSTVLPQGNSDDNKLSCALYVYDSVGARSDVKVEVTVRPGPVAKVDLLSSLDSLMSDAPSFDSVFGPVLDTVTTVNCSLAPDCSTLYNREKCSSVPHTCGPCLSTGDFFGEDGHHNSRCAMRRSIYGDDSNLTCVLDSSCAPFKSCVGSTCVAVPKQCPASCSGHGKCQHVVHNSGVELVGGLCMVGNASCSAICSCNAQWYGSACSRSEAEMLLDSVLYSRVVCLFADEVVQSVEISEDIINSWVDALSILSQEPSAFTHASSMCSLRAQDHILGLIRDSSSTFTIDVVQKVLDSVSTVLNYHQFFDYPVQTLAQKAERLQSLTRILRTYCEVISSVMVSGEHPFEASRSRLRMMSVVLAAEISTTELKFSASEVELFHNISTSTIILPSPVAGDWCMMLLDTVVYSDLSDGSINSNALSIMSPNSSLPGRNITHSGEFFWLSLEDVTSVDAMVELPRTAHNVTCSDSVLNTYLYISCPHNMTHEMYCDEEAVGVWEVICPAVTANMTCSTVHSSATGLSVNDSECTVVSVSGNHVACECPMSVLLHSELGSNDTLNGDRLMVDVEFAASQSYFVENFVGTWRSVKDVKIKDVKDSWIVVTTLGVLLPLICASLYVADKVDKKMVTVINPPEENPLESSDCPIYGTPEVVNLDTLFPSILTGKKFYTLFLRELQISHRWISLFFKNDLAVPLFLQCLSLSSLIICSIFFISVLLSATNPDDGSCDDYFNENDCLQEHSRLISYETKCFWEEGSCHYKEVNKSALTIIFVAVVSAFFSIPVMIIVEYFTITAWTAPNIIPSTDSELKSQPLSGPNTLRRKQINLDDSSSLKIKTANDRMKALLSELHDHMCTCGPAERKKLEAIWRLKYSQIFFYLKSVSLSPQNLQEDPFATPLLSGYRGKINSVRPATSIDAVNDTNPSSQDILMKKPSQSKLLIRPALQHDDMSIFNQMLSNFLALQVQIEQESLILSSMPHEEQGKRLLYLFQKDLLERSVAEIVENKAMIRHREWQQKPVDRRWKVATMGFIIVLDIMMILYVFLFGIEHDRPYQMAWLLALVFWIFLEVCFVSVLVMVISAFMIPAAVLSESKRVKSIMINTVYDYQSKAMDVDYFNSDVDSDSSTFNAAQFLFLSSQLAVRFPDNLGSRIVREYKTTSPQHSRDIAVKLTSNLKLIDRGILLLVGVLNSIKFAFLNLISFIVSASFFPLERLLYDLVSWTVIGFFSFLQAVIFQGNAFLSFILYLSFVLAALTMLYYYCVSTCKLNGEASQGIIYLKTNVKGKEATTEEKQFPRHEVVQRLGKVKNSGLYPKQKSVLDMKQSQQNLNSHLMSSCRDIIASRDGSGLDVPDNIDVSSFGREDINSNNLEVDNFWQKRRTGPSIVDRHDMSSNSDDEIDHDDLFDEVSFENDDEYINDTVHHDNNILATADEDAIGANKPRHRISFQEAGRRVIIQKRVVSRLFTKPKLLASEPKVNAESKQISALLQRIRRNHDAIKQLALKKKVQNIEDAFVLNTQAHRFSNAANQARAHDKLQRRIKDKNKQKGTLQINIDRIDEEKDEEHDKGQAKEMKKLSSFEIFKEKKNVKKSYTAHQTLRNLTLEAKKREAKEALKLKLKKKAKFNPKSGPYGGS